jgi:hypothetical protein
MVAMSRWFRTPVFLIVASVSLIGCNVNTQIGNPDNGGSSNTSGADGSGSAQTPQPNNDALPDFSLTDANANSARYQEAVSPREYLGQISAWYFGHST